SVAGGMVATRASSEASLGSDLSRQLLPRSRPLWIASGVMFSLGMIPGLPKFSFFLVAVVMAFLARQAKATAAAQEAEQKSETAAGKAKAAEAPPAMPKLDDLSMEVGYALVPLVDEAQGGQMLKRVRALRRHLALQLGFVIPPVHITDNPQLKPREYVVRLRNVEIARWQTESNSLLAISAETQAPHIEGKETREPAFGVAAKWIDPRLRENALAAGYAVVDQTSAIATHLAELIKRYAHELLTRQETKRLLDSLSETQPKLVEELVPKALSLGEVHRVLQQLLREQVSIRDLPAILEALLDASVVGKNPVMLVEAARQTLCRALVQPLLNDEGKLTVVTIDPQLEEQIQQIFETQATQGRPPATQISFVRRILDGLRSFMGEQVSLTCPALLVSSPARFHLRRLLEPFLPKLVVISPAEIPNSVTVQSMGVVR
ncbi:MAG TPA: flagellar biosynthesis protein FlhA, partial [Terriglobia bacterium]|nr:flagellar biosynthesis protein FlhA [Terriglobia bacterium]